jgi:hypothetical protein
VNHGFSIVLTYQPQLLLVVFGIQARRLSPFAESRLLTTSVGLDRDLVFLAGAFVFGADVRMPLASMSNDTSI